MSDKYNLGKSSKRISLLHMDVKKLKAKKSIIYKNKLLNKNIMKDYRKNIDKNFTKKKSSNKSNSKTGSNFYKPANLSINYALNFKRNKNFMDIKKLKLDNLLSSKKRNISKSPIPMLKKYKKPFNYTKFAPNFSKKTKNLMKNSPHRNIRKKLKSYKIKKDNNISNFVFDKKKSLNLVINLKKNESKMELEKEEEEDEEEEGRIEFEKIIYDENKIKEKKQKNFRITSLISSGYKNSYFNKSEYQNLNETNNIKMIKNNRFLKTKKKTIKISSKYNQILKCIKNNFRILQGLGEGNFASIFLGEEKTSKTLVALKISKSPKFSLEKEYKILSLFNNPNIIKTKGFKKDENTNSSILILEYAGSRTLKDFQSSLNKNCFEENTTLFYIQQIIKALKDLHIHKIAHSDIKLENIVVEDNSNTCKLIDFGFADFHNTKINDFCCGALGYMSPQLLAKKQYCAFKSDIWALGILTYKMLFNIFPFKGRDEMDILRRVKSGNIFFPSTIRCSNNIKKFIKGLLIYKENGRPGIDKVESLFFKLFL